MLKLLIKFFIFSTLLSSILVITSKNPVVSVVYLITAFVCAALLLLNIGINFIGIAYILVYVGAVAILFLFVIMMLNIKLTDIIETGPQYTKSIPLALSIGGLLTFIFFTLLNLYNWNFENIMSDNILNSANYLNNFYLSGDSSKLLDSTNEFVYLTENSNLPDQNIIPLSQIQAIAYNLYTNGAINLIIISLILLLAMVAAIYLAL